MDGDHPDGDVAGPRPCSARERTLADEAAFTALYRDDLHDLVRFLMKAVGANIHDAADAAQKAYTLAWQAWNTLTKPRAWVRTVARREYYRSSPNRDIVTDSPPDRPVLLTPESCLETSERTKIAHRLLGMLPMTQRIVLAWFTDGFSIDEIANELAMTPAAVRQNLHRARTAMKKQLKTIVGEVPHGH